MTEPLVLSRYRLAQFLICQRRFQLRFVAALAWPSWPDDQERTQARQAGEQFHRLLERNFLGLDRGDPAPTATGQLAEWWEVFRRQGPPLPVGKRLAEYTLTVPIGRAFLTGRFDLLVVDGHQVHIFDWKTEREPGDERVLAADLQTRVYQALATAGGQALTTDGQPIEPERVRLTVWYVRAPEATVTVTYSREQHERNWATLERLVDLVTVQIAADEPVWPLTDDLEACARCAYRLFCGRGDVSPLPAQEDLSRDEADPMAPIPAQEW